MQIDASKVKAIVAPTSEGPMYAVYGSNKATREALAARFGKPRPGGNFILTPDEFYRLKAIAKASA